MQKKVGNALYVFDTTPFTITEDTDAEVIYVQQEYLKGYLELNTELESKIKTFNQWVLCVNAPWADEVTPGPGPTPNYHLLTVSSTDNLWVQNYDETMPPGNTNESWFTSFVNWQVEAGMIGSEERNKIYCNAGAIIYLDIDFNEIETISGLEQMTIPYRGEKYGFVMGDADMTVDFSYTLKPKYHVNFTEDSNAPADVEINPPDQVAGSNVYIRFLNGQSSSTIAVTSTDVELTYDQPNDEYYFTMPEHNVNIKAVYKQPIQISLNLGDTDLTCASYEPSGTYYPHASFVVQVPEGKTPDNYTFVTSDNEHIVVNPIENRFEVEFMASGTVTFANA